jgi:hypothetical protein
VTFDDLIDAECEAESQIRQALLALEAKTGLRLNYVRVICPTLEVDVSLKPRDLQNNPEST